MMIIYFQKDVETALNTKLPSELLTKLSGISVSGGDDCPELAIRGLKNALEHALPNSIAYVFSDASAKDFDLRDSVIKEIQKKQVKVNFLLTGVCGDGKSAPGYKVYLDISRASGGTTFDMKRDSLEEILLAMSDSMESNFESVKSVDFASGGRSVTPLKVDQSLKRLSITLAGLNTDLNVKDHNNLTIVPNTKFFSDNVKFMTFDVADSYYSIEASSDAAHSLRVGGLSELKFEFGFSTGYPKEQAETSIQPLVGYENILTIFVSDPVLVKCLTHATLSPADKSATFDDIEIPLGRVKADMFTSNFFEIPSEMFVITVYGYDKSGNEIERTISSGIESITGGELTH